MSNSEPIPSYGYREALHKRRSSLKRKSDEVSKFTRRDYLTREELDQKTRDLAKEKIYLKREVERLRKQVEKAVAAYSMLTAFMYLVR